LRKIAFSVTDSDADAFRHPSLFFLAYDHRKSSSLG
jgi:hypothetical protein